MAGIYIHIPFCTSKCNYCDFYSITDLALTDKYMAALSAEIRHRGTELSGGGFEPVSSIFFGGGTPSVVDPGFIQRTIDCIANNNTIEDGCEITFEANPGTLDRAKLSHLRRAGINRLSLGVQSFVDSELKAIGRIHDGRQAIRAIETAAEAGFANIGIDILISIPGQTSDSLEYSLTMGIGLAVKHVSAYVLTYEPGTPLYEELINKKVRKATAGFERKLFLAVDRLLTARGFLHYEISNYSYPGFECRHNLNYWRGGEYLGFGASAHGYIGGRRYWNVRNVAGYIELVRQTGQAEEDSEWLTMKDRLAEFILLGLRSEGLDLEKLLKVFGVDLLSVCNKWITEILKSELAVVTASRLRLTAKGWLVCDEIAATMLKLVEAGENNFIC